MAPPACMIIRGRSWIGGGTPGGLADVGSASKEGRESCRCCSASTPSSTPMSKTRSQRNRGTPLLTIHMAARTPLVPPCVQATVQHDVASAPEALHGDAPRFERRKTWLDPPEFWRESAKSLKLHIERVYGLRYCASFVLRSAARMVVEMKDEHESPGSGRRPQFSVIHLRHFQTPYFP